MRSTALAIAIGATALLTCGNAGAFPLAPVESAAAVDSSLLMVRDGCGRGFRYSRRAGGCVPDRPVYVRPAPPPPVYIRPAPPPPVYVRPACPPGQRWSNRFRSCVWL
jgi:hypothetical protein